MTEEVLDFLKDFPPGVYVGTVKFLESEETLREKFGEDFENKEFISCMNIGYCPSFDNTNKTFEAFLLNEFSDDYYGFKVQINCSYYLRSEANFSQLNHLILAIHNDIEVTKQLLLH